MSRADILYRKTCEKILSEGVYRPLRASALAAHTVKCFGVVNRYDLREEFPIMQLI